ncbi:origin recognition complex subunit 4 [Diorhabda carinulata]|uniref:origin recognition complex subunit 4 n=1 Tax=Diorhabda carinulata TaxID=1163345 RepID=UPI0025A25B89|nr:origin recognition complex subunit 4 [Diorhabda carinulata]
MVIQKEFDSKEIRTVLKHNILNNKYFICHDKERKQILDLIERTFKFGESNSALLIGPKGCGKTTIVLNVLEELQTKPLFLKDSMVVKLHGLIHTDDRLALKSITTQMNLDNVVDGKVFGTFAENLSFLLACLRTGNSHTSKSVIFILEEFDLFCLHHNQTLLYNLFDISQSAQAPICVLGITSRIDVIELLEKRVKSRFSHRQIFVFPNVSDANKSLDYLLHKIKYYLTVPDYNNKISKNSKKSWNSSIENLLTNKKFQSIVQRLADIDITERTLKNILINIVFKMEDYLSAEMFQEELKALEQDDMLLLLQDLNVLELCLLISMKHHSEIYDGQSMNYEMILSRYNKFAKSNSSMQNVPRSVAMKAFEHIESLELISMVSDGGSKTQKEYRFFNLLVMPSQILEAVKVTPGLPTEVVQWANSSLI